jgi:hypothetical protein
MIFPRSLPLPGAILSRTSAVLLLALSAGCRRSTPPEQTEAKRPIAMQAPTFQSTKVTAFSAPYASSLRSSRVDVARRPLKTIERKLIHDCGELGSRPRHAAPFSLAVSPDARHGALISKSAGELLDLEGCALGWCEGDVSAFDDHVVTAGRSVTWDQKTLLEDAGLVPGLTLAWRLEGSRYVAVVKAASAPGDSYYPPAVGVQIAPRGKTTGAVTSVQATAAVAAIADDLSAVVAFDTGKLRVYSTSADVDVAPQLFAERDVGGLPAWLSLIGKRIMLVFRSDGGSRLDALEADTKPAYAVKVPFEVLQPAIAGGAERVYLAGRGLAAFDREKLAWTLPSESPVYASAFEDGSLAVAFGKRLDFVKPDGSVAQSFPVEEPLVAPPAIAADGSVWAASETALYLVR